MQPLDERIPRSEVAATLTRLFDEVVFRNQARQQQAATVDALSELPPSPGPAEWGVGLAQLEALAKFAGYPDLASACARLVSLEGLSPPEIEDLSQQPKGNVPDGQ